jgi:hypothetical protein
LPTNGISITDQLDPYEWSDEETAAYEAATEAVNGAVGAYNALIAAEEAKDEPDQAVVAEARAAQARLAREREALRSADREQITAARAHYAQLARDVLAVPHDRSGRGRTVPAPGGGEPAYLPRADRARPPRRPRAAGDARVVFLVGQPGARQEQGHRDGGRPTQPARRLRGRRQRPVQALPPRLRGADGAGRHLMAAYTRADGRVWMAQAEQYVREHGLHAIIQETWQNAQRWRRRCVLTARRGRASRACSWGCRRP